MTSAIEVPRELTPISKSDLFRALRDGAQARLGYVPRPAVIAVALAQLLEEHGVKNGLVNGVWDDNLGNIDATTTQRADPTVHIFRTVFEREGSGSDIWSAQHVREAFATPADGAGYWWLTMQERFFSAWQALVWTRPVDADGNALSEEATAPIIARAFAHALKVCGYYTGSETDYTAALVRLAPEGLRVWQEA
jgi:hypothetical protein